MLTSSGLYVGRLRHRRFAPRNHEFEYPIFMALLDIDRLPELMKVSRLCSLNRRNWASFDNRDHFGNPLVPLRQRLSDDAASQGLTLPDGRIFLLTHLRYLGYNFNPVSFFYCCNAGGSVEGILAEVNNTFGETRNYWLTENQRLPGAERAYSFSKQLHVSPFMEMDCDYRFGFNEPGDRISIHTDVRRNGDALFDATLTLERLDWNAANLRRTLVRYPWMTAAVTAGIHWQALKLFLKKIPVISHPGPGLFAKVNPKHSWPERTH